MIYDAFLSLCFAVFVSSLGVAMYAASIAGVKWATFQKRYSVFSSLLPLPVVVSRLENLSLKSGWLVEIASAL
jgi:hypothetical protein